MILPYQFRAGYLSAEDAAQLTRMAQALSGQTGLDAVPPLSIIRQGYDGQPVLCLDTSGLGTSLTTSNADGTEGGTSTDLRFDQATGSHKRARGTGETWDTHELLAASPSQMGAVTTTGQMWKGYKMILYSGSFGVYAESSGNSDVVAVYADGDAGGVQNMGLKANRTVPDTGGGSVDSNNLMFAFNPDTSWNITGGGGYAVLGNADGYGGWRHTTANFAAIDGGGNVRQGITRDFATGECPIVVGGLVVGYWSGSGSPPTVPVVPPPTATPATVSGHVTSGPPSFTPAVGRTITLGGTSSATTTTDAAGAYSFTGVVPGLNNVAISTLTGGEYDSYSLDGGMFTSGSVVFFPVAAGSSHTLDWYTDGGSAPTTGTLVVTITFGGSAVSGAASSLTYSGGGTFVESPTGTYTLTGVTPATGQSVSYSYGGGYTESWTVDTPSGSGSGSTNPSVATPVTVAAGGTTTVTFSSAGVSPPPP